MLIDNGPIQVITFIYTNNQHAQKSSGKYKIPLLRFNCIVNKFSIGANHAMFQIDKSIVFVIGSNQYGQITLGSDVTASKIPRALDNSKHIVDFACNNDNSIIYYSKDYRSPFIYGLIKTVYYVDIDIQNRHGFEINRLINILQKDPDFIAVVSCTPYTLTISKYTTTSSFTPNYLVINSPRSAASN